MLLILTSGRIPVKTKIIVSWKDAINLTNKYTILPIQIFETVDIIIKAILLIKKLNSKDKACLMS